MQKTLKLNSGYEMPLLGLGTWESKPGEVKAAVKSAILDSGYTHIDCARVYGNEPEVGEAFSEIFNDSASKVKREDIFITSKLWNCDHDPKFVEETCRKTLSDLKLEYLDLYLIHWGVGLVHNGEMHPMKDGHVLLAPISIQETWQAMEKLVEKGLVKSIGVANFTGPMIIDLLTYAKIKPAMNQIELHPYNAQTALVKYCQEQGVAVTAYSPLGRMGAVNIAGMKLGEEKIITDLASKYHKSATQILLNWAVSRNTVAIPKSVNPGRIAENSAIFDFELSEDEIKRITSLNKNFRFVDPSEVWGVPYFS